jgi:ankyrin repeat protein
MYCHMTIFVLIYRSKVLDGISMCARIVKSDCNLLGASENGDMANAKKALAIGADVNAKNSRGQTPLHFAAFYNDTELAEMLIDNGADVNAKNSRGQTPLHLAAYCGHTSLAKMLIDKGGDANVKDSVGHTPLSLATYHDHIGTMEILRQFDITDRIVIPKRDDQLFLKRTTPRR